METPATQLIRMTHELLNMPMQHLTRSQIVKQDTILLSDGSTILYNIDITIQTEQEHSRAYTTIRDISNISIIEPIEQLLVHLFYDPSPDVAEDEDPVDILTAADYPECAQ